MAINDITGDQIKSGVLSKQGRINHDLIFAKKTAQELVNFVPEYKPLNQMYLFLDDLRLPKDAWIYPRRDDKKQIITGRSLENISGIPNGNWDIVRTYEQFVDYLEKNGIPDVISFDHDLHVEHINHYHDVTNFIGLVEYGNLKIPTGKHCAEYLIDKWNEAGRIKTPTCYIHSANQCGAKNIKEVLNQLYSNGTSI